MSTCEDWTRQNGRCNAAARWITPGLNFATGTCSDTGKKAVCGRHKHRWESYVHRCTPLNGGAQS